MALDRERLLQTYAPRLAAQRAAAPVPGQARDAVDLLNDMVQEIEDRDEKDPDETAEHTGVMVAFFLDPESAKALALSEDDCEKAAEMPSAMPSPTGNSMPKGLPIGEDDCQEDDDTLDVEDPEELHVTLAYLGDAGVDVPDSMLPTLLATVKGWAASHQPMTGVVSGVGLFNNEGGKVTYASVDVPDLPHARQELVRQLTEAGLTVSADHGFTPHITLAYGDARNAEVPRLPLTFSSVTVAFGGQRTAFTMAAPSSAHDGRAPQLDTAAERARMYTTPRIPAGSVAVSTSTSDVSWNPVVTNVGARTFITAPATTERAAMWDTPPNPNKHMLWMQGRFVGAERANKNGAFWSSADLEMGKPSVAHGPLNWLHDEKRVIGTIADAKFIPYPGGGGLQVAAAMDGMGGMPECNDPHISALSAIWRWIYPDEASIVQMASDAQVLAYSMECISEAIQCVGDNGCGETYPYMEYAQGKTCDHLQARASIRRLVNPTFLGGAVIVPPTRPGWGEADARVMAAAARHAEKAFDQAGRPDIPAATWEQLMAGVLTFAGIRQ